MPSFKPASCTASRMELTTLPGEICSNALIAIGSFSSELEAKNLQKYTLTKFFRFMVGVKKVSQVLTSNVYHFVPIQDFTSNSDIDWEDSVQNIDVQLYKKYNFTSEQINYVESKIKYL